MNADLTAIRSFDKLGILTCFAFYSKPNVKRLYGISAAHVLLGKNRKVELNDTIDIYYSKNHLNWFKEAGLLEKAYFINGTGVFPEWGMLDAGSFLIRPQVSKLIMSKLTPMKFSSKLKDLSLLKNTIVYGYAVQTDMLLKGVVSKVLVKSEKFNLNFDVQIRFINGTTNAGDSGMLWKTQNGTAVAMHVYGDNSNSYSTLIDRVRDKIGMPLFRIK